MSTPTFQPTLISSLRRHLKQKRKQHLSLLILFFLSLSLFALFNFARVSYGKIDKKLNGSDRNRTGDLLRVKQT